MSDEMSDPQSEAVAKLEAEGWQIIGKNAPEDEHGEKVLVGVHLHLPGSHGDRLVRRDGSVQNIFPAGG